MQVNDLKVSSFSAATEKAIVVAANLRLVPVGEWVFQHPDLIAQMAIWRQENMAMFCAKFESTPAKTEQYLRVASIGQPNRVLFQIYENNRMIGHLGLSKITDKTAELDNVMRGIRAETSSMMSLCIGAVCEWAKSQLGLSSLSLQVLNTNQKAVTLYENCGFQILSDSALKATQQGDVTQYVECSDDEATTSTRSLIMTKSI